MTATGESAGVRTVGAQARDIEIELLRRDISDRFDRIERSVLSLAAEINASQASPAGSLGEIKDLLHGLVQASEPAGTPTARRAGPARDVPELLTAALAAFGTAGSIHTQTLAAALGTSVEDLGRLLSSAGVQANRNPIRIRGQQARGYKRAAVEKAINRIVQGEASVSALVRSWSADSL